jgi:hypothetical protein
MVLGFSNNVMYFGCIGHFLVCRLPGVSVSLMNTTDTSLASLDLRHLLNIVLTTGAAVPRFRGAVLQFTLSITAQMYHLVK